MNHGGREKPATLTVPTIVVVVRSEEVLRWAVLARRVRTNPRVAFICTPHSSRAKIRSAVSATPSTKQICLSHTSNNYSLLERSSNNLYVLPSSSKYSLMLRSFAEPALNRSRASVLRLEISGWRIRKQRSQPRPAWKRLPLTLLPTICTARLLTSFPSTCAFNEEMRQPNLKGKAYRAHDRLKPL